ncbi:MAG: tetratricopeptide repeat protein [Thermodesulfobacteriota bacterium]
MTLVKNKLANVAWPYVFICLFTCTSYFPTLSGDFILDDHPLVKDNPFIQEPQGIAAYLSQEDGVTHVYRGEKIHTGYYRPLINMTYRLDYLIWGMNAPGFRLSNLVFHVLTSLVLYSLFCRFSMGRVAAFLSAVFFALHPVNSEAVSWISSRNNVLAALWGLLAFGFHVTAWERKRTWGYAVSTLFFGVAVFSKEFGIMVLPLLFLYHRVLAKNLSANRVSPLWQRGAGGDLMRNALENPPKSPFPKGGLCGFPYLRISSKRRKDLAVEAASYLPLALVLLLYVWLRGEATGGFLSMGSEATPLLRRIAYAPYLMLLNLGLVLLPSGLHSFIVTYPRGIFTWQAFVGFAFLGLCIFALWKLRKRGMFCFGLAGFLLTLLPVLNLIPVSSVTLLSMRWLYFPMAAILFAVTDGLRLFLDWRRHAALALCLLVTAYLGMYTWMLNAHLWRDEASFFRQEVVRFGNLHYAGGLAEKLQEAGQLAESERYFRMAIDRYPGAAKNYINYSALMIDTGRPGEAVALLAKARPLAMTVREGAEWENNMGMALFAAGNPEQALEHLKEAVAAYPMEPVFWSNLGAVYGSAGDLDASEAAFRSGLERSPQSALLRRNLAVTYAKRGEHERARDLLQGKCRE